MLKGIVEPPSELKGVVYADFRRSFKKGLEAVLAALSKEADAVVIAVGENWNVLLRRPSTIMALRALVATMIPLTMIT